MAAQVTSRSSVRLIDVSIKTSYCKYTEAELNLLREVILKVDCLIDIMNATKTDDADFISCERIDCPLHFHIKELLYILAVFFEWKNTIGKFSEMFIARETYEDLVWLIGRLVCASKMYLKEEK